MTDNGYLCCPPPIRDRISTLCSYLLHLIVVLVYLVEKRRGGD